MFSFIDAQTIMTLTGVAIMLLSIAIAGTVLLQMSLSNKVVRLREELRASKLPSPELT